MVRFRRFCVDSGLLICALTTALLASTAHAEAEQLPRPIHGAYSAALSTREAGGVDISGTLDRLSRAHVDTYAYELCGGTSDWDRLPAFLDAAEDRGIKVWAYLCPPSETTVDSGGADFPPFGWDYPHWAAELAHMSLDHPALTAFAIDDFAENTDLFTPDYAAQTAHAARAVNPRFRFYPVLYYRDLVGPGTMVQPYLQTIDGVIFPFRDEPAYDTVVSDTAAAQIVRVRQALGNRALIVMIYGESFSRQTNPGPPAPQYVEAIARDALALAEYGVDDGVVIYKMNLTGKDTPSSRAEVYDRVKSVFGRH